MNDTQTRSTPKNFLVFLMVLLMVGVGAAGVYFVDTLYFRPMREQRRMIENLKNIAARLTKDERIAEVQVLEQAPASDAKNSEVAKTTFKFVEVDEKHNPIGEPRTITIEGDVAYFDTLVIKFQEKFDPVNELPLKDAELSQQLFNKSLIVFRRVFGEHQKPVDGFPLDVPGEAPAGYKGKAPPTAFEQKLWAEFWTLANDPKLAEERGVRAAHGEAVYTKLQKGKVYVLERRLTGDLTIRPMEMPAVTR